MPLGARGYWSAVVCYLLSFLPFLSFSVLSYKAHHDARADDEIYDVLKSELAGGSSRHHLHTTHQQRHEHMQYIDPWGTRDRTQNQHKQMALPLCNLSCSDIVHRSIVLPPLSSHLPSKRPGRSYDWSCFASHFTYHIPPNCKPQLELGTLGPEALSWTTRDALLNKCRLPDWSPAAAA